jgi:hypothetical protein
MKDFLHKLLVYCGWILVGLRFVPTEPGGYLHKLFFNDAIHNRIGDFFIKMSVSIGLVGEQYQTQISGVSSLAHFFALIIEAFGIALTFYIITRWI